MSKLGKALWKQLDDDLAWKISEHRIKHTPSGLYFWIGFNGFFFNVEDQSAGLGLLERHWLRQKAKRMIDRYNAGKLEGIYK